MTTLKTWIFAIGIALAPTIALAENTVPFPNYPDPNVACRTLAGSNTSAMNDCISSDQQGYDEAKLLWPDLNQKSAETCVRAVNPSAWAYTVLGNCVSVYFSAQPKAPLTFQK